MSVWSRSWNQSHRSEFKADCHLTRAHAEFLPRERQHALANRHAAAGSDRRFVLQVRRLEADRDVSPSLTAKGGQASVFQEGAPPVNPTSGCDKNSSKDWKATAHCESDSAKRALVGEAKTTCPKAHYP